MAESDGWEDITPLVDAVYALMRKHKASQQVGAVVMEITMIQTLMRNDVSKSDALEMISIHWDQLAQTPQHFDA
jgi:hypothetical protein